MPSATSSALTWSAADSSVRAVTRTGLPSTAACASVHTGDISMRLPVGRSSGPKTPLSRTTRWSKPNSSA